MSYVHHKDDTLRGAGLPFAEVLAPMWYFGEAIYTGLEAVAMAVAAGARWIGRRWRAHRSVAVLSVLNDHMLKDIGLYRSEIRYLAHKIAENPDMDYRMIR